MSAFPETWRDDLLAAFTFLTRLPLRRAYGEGPVATSLAGASWAFPLVGVVIGIIGGIVYVVAVEIGLPALAAALTSSRVILARGRSLRRKAACSMPGTTMSST